MESLSALIDSNELDFNKTFIKKVPNGILEKFLKTNEDSQSSKSKKKSKSWKSWQKSDWKSLISRNNTTSESENDSFALDKVVWLEAAINELEIMNGTLKLALEH